MDDELKKEKSAEASRLMARLGLLLDKKRVLDRWLFRLRHRDTMKIAWTRQSKREDSIINEMLRWLRNKENKQNE